MEKFTWSKKVVFGEDYLRVNINLLSFMFAEEIEHEGSDGVVRKGVFIPTEENDAYTKWKGKIYVGMNAFKTSEYYKRVFKAQSSHILLPYWKMSHVEKMKSLGYTRQDRFMGFIMPMKRNITY